MTTRPNVRRLKQSLRLLRNLTKLRSDPLSSDAALDRARDELAEHDDDARRRVDPRQLKLWGSNVPK